MKKIHIGGQAVIEGVMMRGKNFYSIVVRKSDGQLVIHKDKLKSLPGRFPFLKLPILRGCAALIENLILGIKALSFSANQFLTDEAGGSKDSSKELSSVEIFLTILFSLGIGFILFFLFPLLLTNLIKNNFDIFRYTVIFNFIDGFFRVIIFILYIYIISGLKDIQRVFQYHGAEHKAVFNFESDSNLSVEHAMKFSPLHPRCGTSFLLLVMVISILIFSFIPREISLMYKALWRLCMAPLIVGVSYEIIKLGGENLSNPFIKILMKPGLYLQKLTTREPTEDQIIVAITALKEVISLENP
ncbi:DUF1385 domain-containing protein [Candidatus Desantisbacteria bacterium]|nr:DUF1385 domain-containing protein [Candidatus Desantisbacteria bacterium]